MEHNIGAISLEGGRSNIIATCCKQRGGIHSQVPCFLHAIAVSTVTVFTTLFLLLLLLLYYYSNTITTTTTTVPLLLLLLSLLLPLQLHLVPLQLVPTTTAATVPLLLRRLPRKIYCNGSCIHTVVVLLRYHADS